MDGLLRAVLGILIGAGLYSEVYPLISDTLLKAGAYGKLTIPGLLDVNHWIVIVPAALGLWAFLYWVDRKGL